MRGWWILLCSAIKETFPPNRGTVLNIILGTFGAILACLVVLALVYFLPISERLKPFVFLWLGVTGLFGSYLVLMTMPSTNNKKKPPTIKPTAHCHDDCKGTKDTNNILFQTPVIPNTPTKIIKSANNKVTTTNPAFSIYSTFQSKIRLNQFGLWCYNLICHLPKGIMGWTGLEPVNRLHGSAFQERHVCLSITSPSFDRAGNGYFERCAVPARSLLNYINYLPNKYVRQAFENVYLLQI
jgi:uncharacterized membrane protein YeaQ/YmgE (transglycosylase-associated protein family)